MDIARTLRDLNLDDSDKPTFQYVDAFKNPSKMPINQIHLERNSFHLKKEIPKDIDILNLSVKDIKGDYYEKKVEVIPALDVRWLPKCVLSTFESYIFNLPSEENEAFITNNVAFIESLEYLLKCNYHQFWCTVLFEPTTVLALRSFLLNPIPPYQAKYLYGEHQNIYVTILRSFQLVYERLITFKASEIEYMSEDYGLKILIEKKLLNLPIVNTLAWLYKVTHLSFVNKLTGLYFNDTSQLDFQIKEVEEIINQNLRIFEVISRHVCRFETNTEVLPIALTPRPSIFDLSWVYSVVNYLLNAVSLLNTLLQFYKPAVEMCMDNELPFKIPSTYVTVYNEIYEMLDDREELTLQKDLSDKVFDEMNLGRSEFVDLFHSFISYCLDKTLEYLDDNKQQDHIVEVYIKLLTTALEDEYFICDYDQKYNVANQNEMFENCSSLDVTRTQFIVSCINKLQRHKQLEQLSKLGRKTIENVFKDFKPPEIEQEIPEEVPVLQNSDTPKETEIEVMIKDIIDMFPHLGDGFVLKCLESYNYKSNDVINAILEENLPPHLYEIPFDTIRIPPEPEPEKPTIAYWGKKPDYEDAMSLLDDKKDIQQLKTSVLDGVQYSNNYLYDDEYDDRDDDDVPIKVADNPLEKEVLTYNPNHDELASDTSDSSEEYDDNGRPFKANGKGAEGNAAAGNDADRTKKRDFCVDPAILRAQREAKFKSRRPQPSQPRSNVLGKPKGQGQEKDVLKARDKKNVNKSSRANHSRKGGAQFKRSRGMIPS